MGNLIESSIKAITALDEQNIDSAKQVIEKDKEIDNMEDY